MTPPKPVTLEQVIDIVLKGQNALKVDFDEKHKENRDRRHALGNTLSAMEGRQALIETRMATAETKLIAIVGDSSGGSGLLHSIDKKVDKLQEDFSILKSAVEDAPLIRKWVYGAIAVLAFITVAVPIILVVLFEILKLASKH